MKDFNKILMNLEKNSDKVLNKSLEESAEIVLKRSNKLVPVDTGRLKASGRVRKRANKVMLVEYRTPYAVYVENDLSVNHPIHEDGRDCGGQAKFLFTAMMNMEKVVLKKIKGDIL